MISSGPYKADEQHKKNITSHRPTTFWDFQISYSTLEGKRVAAGIAGFCQVEGGAVEELVVELEDEVLLIVAE